MNKAVFFVFSSLLFAACSSTSYQALVGQRSPETRFYLVNGETLPVSAFKGKTTVLVFWASWCSRSKQLLNKLDQYVSTHNPLGVEYVLISIDKQENFEKMKNFAANLQGRFKIAFSGNENYDEAYQSFRGEEIPLVIILDRAGTVVAGGHDFETVENALKFALPAK